MHSLNESIKKLEAKLEVLDMTPDSKGIINDRVMLRFALDNLRNARGYLERLVEASIDETI